MGKSREPQEPREGCLTTWVVREGFPEEETLSGDLGGKELTGGTESHG